jgi:hypothetical protein
VTEEAVPGLGVVVARASLDEESTSDSGPKGEEAALSHGGCGRKKCKAPLVGDVQWAVADME